jgi:hypothetical protein
VLAGDAVLVYRLVIGKTVKSLAVDARADRGMTVCEAQRYLAAM